MFPLRLFFLVLAAVMFLLAGLGVPEPPRLRFIGWGLLFYVVSLFATH